MANAFAVPSTRTLAQLDVTEGDITIEDLEDAVTLREKDAARILVFHALQHPLYLDIETVVRINPLDSPFGLDDLQAAVRGGAHIVRLPKTDTADDVLQLVAEIERIESACGRTVSSTQAMAAIESAAGVVNAVAIATASPRMMGIALAGFDYVMDMQTERGDGTELCYARCAVLHAARVAKINAFDVVFPDVNDDVGFLKEVDLMRPPVLWKTACARLASRLRLRWAASAAALWICTKRA